MPRLRPPRDPVTIHFDGEAVVAERGEPVAGGPRRGGHLALARSPKFHRPRGPVVLARGVRRLPRARRRVPNMMTCRVPAAEGMRIETQNVVGSQGHRSAAHGRLVLPGGHEPPRALCRRPRASSGSCRGSPGASPGSASSPRRRPPLRDPAGAAARSRRAGRRRRAGRDGGRAGARARAGAGSRWSRTTSPGAGGRGLLAGVEVDAWAALDDGVRRGRGWSRVSSCASGRPPPASTATTSSLVTNATRATPTGARRSRWSARAPSSLRPGPTTGSWRSKETTSPA